MSKSRIFIIYLPILFTIEFMKNTYVVNHISKSLAIIHGIIYIFIILKDINHFTDIFIGCVSLILSSGAFFMMAIYIHTTPDLWKKITALSIQIGLFLLSLYETYNLLYLNNSDIMGSVISLYVIMPIIILYPTAIATILVLASISKRN